MIHKTRFFGALALAVALGSITGSVLTQTNSERPVTTQDVLEMTRAKISPDIIVKSIESAGRVNFDTSPQALVSLKKEGVDDKVIEAMMNLSSGGRASRSIPEASPRTKESDKSVGLEDARRPDKLAEVLVRADVDVIRSIIVQEMAQNGNTLDKDEKHQLVFRKKIGGVKGFVAGTLFGKNQEPPRQITTFLLIKSEEGYVVTGNVGYIYPKRSDDDVPRVQNDKGTRQNFQKLLDEIKSKAEKRG